MPGQIALTAGLFLLVLALLRGNEVGWGSTQIVAEFAGAAVALVAFLVIEARSTHPMLPLRLFRNPSFTGAQIAAFGISASFFAIFLYATLYLQQVLGLSAIEAGLVYLPGTILNFVVAGASSQVGEKVPHRIMISVGLALVAIGMVLFTLAGTGSSWTVVLPGELIALFGVGLFNPSVIAVALGSAPQEQSGLAAGVNDTFRQAGIAVGIAGLGALIPSAAGIGSGSPQEFVDGLHNAFFAGAGLAAAAAVASFFLIRKNNVHHEVVELPIGAEPWPRRPSRARSVERRSYPLGGGRPTFASEPATDLVRVLAQARRPAAHSRRRRAEAQRRAHGAHAVRSRRRARGRARPRRRRPARRR